MFHNTFFLSPGAIFGNYLNEPTEPETYRPGFIVQIGSTIVQYLKKFLIPGTLSATIFTSGEKEADRRIDRNADLNTGPNAETKADAKADPQADPSGDCKVDLKSGSKGGSRAGSKADSKADTKADSKVDTESDTEGNVRRTDLPIYSECPPPSEKPEEPPGKLEQSISVVRKELWVWHDNYKGYREKVVEVVIGAKDQTAVLVEQLRKDELPVPRSGAIAISGLTGVILGLRGGWLKRILYGSTCAGIMTAVCYPKEVSEVSQEALGTTKKYVMIAYNFIYGEKRASEVTMPSVRVPHEQPGDQLQDPTSPKKPCTCPPTCRGFGREKTQKDKGAESSEAK